MNNITSNKYHICISVLIQVFFISEKHIDLYAKQNINHKVHILNWQNTKWKH